MRLSGAQDHNSHSFIPIIREEAVMRDVKELFCTTNNYELARMISSISINFHRINHRRVCEMHNMFVAVGDD